MIHLLNEAENHIQLYQYALDKKLEMQQTEEECQTLEAEWKKRFRLPFPEVRQTDDTITIKNPGGLKRSMLLVAGWCLYHREPTLGIEETQEYLSQWYQTVMSCAAMGMPKKNRSIMLDRISENDKAFRGSREIAQNLNQNLDKINYYRIICQARANGPLREQEIIVPYSIIDHWREKKGEKKGEKKISITERALAILFHYYNGCGIPFEANKTEVAYWISGNSKLGDTKDNAGIEVVEYGEGKRYYLFASKDNRWKEGEPGVTLEDFPPLGEQLTDEALGAKRLESNSDYWLKTSFAPVQDMIKHYNNKNGVDLFTQFAETGLKKPRVKRYLLGILYSASGGSAPSWTSWEEVLPSIPAESVLVNWEEIETWAKENRGLVTRMIDQSQEFFRGKGKGRFSGRVNIKQGIITLVFRSR